MQTYFENLCFIVPRAGVEPARVAPLVFETSASTDSAIWATKRVQRYEYFWKLPTLSPKKIKNS